MKELSLIWLLYIGPSEGPMHYIDQFSSRPACEIAGAVEVHSSKAAWVHCIEDPIPGVMELLTQGEVNDSRTN